VQERLGRINVLLNNAGTITVGELCQQRRDDFARAMDTIYWGSVHCTLAVLPAMRRRRSGSIVNVTSIGATVAAPHLAPYCAAKAAQLAFSEAVQAESARHGVHVLTVIPGFLRTGSPEHVTFLGDSAAEHRWFTVAATTPLLSMPAARAAERIVEATLAGRRHLVLTPLAQLAARTSSLAPSLTSRLLDATARLLATAVTSEGTGREEGGAFTASLPGPSEHIERRAAAAGNQIA